MNKKKERGRKDNPKAGTCRGPAERTRNHHTDTAQKVRYRHSGLHARGKGFRECGLLQTLQAVRPVQRHTHGHAPDKCHRETEECRTGIFHRIPQEREAGREGEQADQVPMVPEVHRGHPGRQILGVLTRAVLPQGGMGELRPDTAQTRRSRAQAHTAAPDGHHRDVLGRVPRPVGVTGHSSRKCSERPSGSTRIPRMTTRHGRGRWTTRTAPEACRFSCTRRIRCSSSWKPRTRQGARTSTTSSASAATTKSQSCSSETRSPPKPPTRAHRHWEPYTRTWRRK